MGKKEFVTVALDLKYKVFIINIVALNLDSDDEIYPLKRAQIAFLKVDKAFFKVLSKYINFVDIFSPKLAVKFLEYTKINNYTIELVDD